MLLLILKGGVGTISLLFLYFLVVSLVSGFAFAKEQFLNYWYFLSFLSIGFGIQVSLYLFLKSKVKSFSKGVLATTGTTSAGAMISCCTHYLVNILPLLGAAGVVSFVSQYQIELFWVGIFFNLMGILYILRRIKKLAI